MAPRIRIPTVADFAPLSPELTVALHFPSPPESTTAILILLHGLGDSEAPFAAFARSVSLPGVLAISARGVSPLAPALLGEPLDSGPPRHFHWGDDLSLAGGELDADPGFSKAADLITDRLIRETLVDKCGWETSDVLLYGFGQGGSLALGLASRIRMGPRVHEVSGDEGGGKAGQERGKALKGVVSVGGPLPMSMVPTVTGRPKAKTPVLVCHGSGSEAIDDEATGLIRQEFADVKVIRWRKREDSMPGSREEMLPIMQFFADRLRSG